MMRSSSGSWWRRRLLLTAAVLLLWVAVAAPPTSAGAPAGQCWATNLARRNNASASCTQAGGGGRCVAPYPGPSFLHPKIHHSPDCLHLAGWHDMAAALTFEGEHHTFQGCPASLGWQHSVSADLVHWTTRDRGIHMLHETFQGMDSKDCGPCSGFVTVDENNTVCAGFLQCGSSKGAIGLNPHARPWDVPLELRCAQDWNLSSWSSAFEVLYPISWYRALPYDPVRPWRDLDGKWYSAWSSDACNGTTQWGPTPPGNLRPPGRGMVCLAGGQLNLMVSDGGLRGATWRELTPLFTTNVTCSGRTCLHGAIPREFVTADYFGGLRGDPDGGATRVITQNFGYVKGGEAKSSPAGPSCGPTYCTGATFWVGKQRAPGSSFEAYWDNVGAVGHYDYGSLTMARTLGSDPNQVATKKGRRGLVGWIAAQAQSPYAPASQSLARDLTLSADYELPQSFVPELQSLRQPASFAKTFVSAESNTTATNHSAGSLQLEVVATFSWTTISPPSTEFGFSVLGGAGTNVTISCDPHNIDARCMVRMLTNGVYGYANASLFPHVGPVLPLDTKTVRVHTIVDNEIVETIVNNRTGIVSYYPSIPSALSTEVTLFGTVAGIEAEIQTWQLDAANNIAEPAWQEGGGYGGRGYH
jgi:hypothetical protein